MKRLFLLILFFISFGVISYSQNLEITAISTKGPIGKNLFPEDSTGNISITGIVDIPYSADTIAALVYDYFYGVEKLNETKLTNKYKGFTKVGCDITLNVGKRIVDIPYAGHFLKAKSTISFSIVVDVRDGKFRYTLTNFLTKRWRISGDAKDQGPSNLIHWQRINCINKEHRAKTAEELVKEETNSYNAEYQSVMVFIEGLKNLNSLLADF